jgi:dTDP-4-amino-4,6-dideoxygalactose transaminase
VIRSTNRDELQKHLSDAGIGTGIHYPIPVHLQKPYASLGCQRGDFPVSEEAADQILSLPMYAGLNAGQQEHVAGAIAEFESAFAMR